MMTRRSYSKRQYPNWAELDPSIDRLLAEGWSVEAIAKDLGFKAGTVRAHLRKRGVTGTPTVHPSTPYEVEVLTVHPSTPESTEILPDEKYTQEHLTIPTDSDHTEGHHGTLEGHQEVMEDISQSVPDAPHIGTEERYQSTPEHPSTPEVHPGLSVDDSGVPEHYGVPARQDHFISTPMVHLGTPSEEDWELWNTIKAMWPRVEKMLSDQQVFLSTPLGTPRQTQKKTYVFDVGHIALIDQYAQDHRLDLKDVIYTAFQEFFERRGYIDDRSPQP